MRICRCCKEELVLDKDAFVIIGKELKFLHYECWVEKKIHAKRSKLSPNEAFRQADNLFIEAKEHLKQKELEIKDRDVFYEYLLDRYNLSSLSSYFFTKLNSIYTGTYKGFSRPIPKEHLYDMFIQKENYLDKVHGNLDKQGKAVKGESKVHYDLAILVGKYDNYLSWLNKQKLLEAEQAEVEIKSNITIRNISKKPQEKKFDVVEDFLNEIFGEEYDEFI